MKRGGNSTCIKKDFWGLYILPGQIQSDLFDHEIAVEYVVDWTGRSECVINSVRGSRVMTRPCYDSRAGDTRIKCSIELRHVSSGYLGATSTTAHYAGRAPSHQTRRVNDFTSAGDLSTLPDKCPRYVTSSTSRTSLNKPRGTTKLDVNEIGALRCLS